MIKGQQSSLVLLALLFIFLAIIFLLKKLEAPPTPTTTTTTLPLSTTTTVTCTEGVRQCSGNGIVYCINGIWVTMTTFCQYGCSNGQCNPEPATTIPVSNCTGTNNRICSYGSKYDCSVSKCCYWDLNASKCKPRLCSDIDEQFCASCGCTPS